MSDATHRPITQILGELDQREDAGGELLALIYDQLRLMARQRMGQERSGHTLQPTALVHEAYLRLIGLEQIEWQSRRHFFGAAAAAMRRILIDHARRKTSIKRGGGQMRLSLESIDLEDEMDAGRLLALDEVLTRLEGEDPRAASIVQLRFFAGLSVEDTAHALELSERTVMREWAFARARLAQLLGED